MTGQNSELIELSRGLNDIATQIHQKKAATNDPAVYAALNNELIEVNHRITMVGGLIFAARSNAITTAVRRVEDSKAELASAIEQIDRMNKFIRTISAFLGLVDEVIDLAKKF
jgi:hypothetical protein